MTHKEYKGKRHFQINQKIHFGIQRKVVSNMTTEAWETIPHVTYIYEPDITDFIDEFKKLNESGKHKDKITLNTLLLKCFVEGIKADPILNSHIEFNKALVRGTVESYEDINISMPYLLPNGEMMTINLHNFENRNLDNMTDYIADIGRKVKNTNLNEVMYDVSLDNTLNALGKGEFIKSLGRLIGSKTGKHKVKNLSGDAKRAYYSIPEKDRLTKEDIEQGTVTISNIGSIYKGQRGALALLEIVPPQVFAIGIGGVQEKPGVYVDENGEKQIGIRKILPLCLAFDHRALDFGELVPFMERLDDIFANPQQIEKW
ncbi:MAG: 2-oxo acid dehydrogenase subunit E2 [Clostridiales bacterium]|nr:2-oxo acid dehydrogenase subunit E2 [Clostridiales bacterium]